MSIEEVAAKAGLSVPTLYNYRHRGLGPDASKEGRFLVYDTQSVAAWLAEREANPPRRGRRKKSA